MIVRDRVYTVNDVWNLAQLPENAAERYYLIDGELFVTLAAGELDGALASEIARLMGNFVVERDLGRVTVETGYYPSDSRQTLLLPDVAFRSRSRAPGPARIGFVPQMPDLAVEIMSPGNTLPEMRRKAEVYLRRGSTLVWLVNPAKKSAEVWRLTENELTSETVGPAGALSGEGVLPGFTLDLSRLFARI